MCSDYVLDSATECERLERQAALDGLERHLHHLPKQPQARVLDAGCGSGAMARLMASSCPEWDIVGIDFNPEYVAYARERAQAESLKNLHFEQGDICALQFAPASFDVVWSRFVLYFLPKPEDALREFRRVVKPGGEIIIALHNWSTLINFPENYDLRDRRERVFSSIADTYLAQKMPAMLSSLEFCDISVNIELDRVYSAIGAIGVEGRRNYVDVLNAGKGLAVQALGSKENAENFIADMLSYLDCPNTYTYSLLWTIKCRAPATR